MDSSISALAAQLQMPGPAPVVPVLSGLRRLLPAGGLRPGAAVRVQGSTALTLALAAAATAAGTWCALIGFPDLGAGAALELGVDLDRVHLVDRPGEHWEAAAAAYTEAAGVLLLRPGGAVGGPGVQRLLAQARRHGCALVVEGSQWPGAQVQLEVTGRSWSGIAAGRGRLRGRRVTVVVGGRGAAAQGREVDLWLPDEDGRVRLAGPAELKGVRSGRARLAAVR
ncbi:hypothetical protein [Streptomyces sp. TLI_171]|uniref:hypothetical protein n=1 Tax=Streptomyces sp. TLI_171 TaxID=1938859 RepID=UPI000C199031|nr:hypothetical protein [Streptomyces sp. TLI_171]RKE02901.1 hypothetical protein BX266_7503 [Streptomyces sp. TLI_171]